MVVHDFQGIRLKTNADGAKISLTEILFFAGLILWFVQYYLDQSVFEGFFGVSFIKEVRYFCMLIFAFTILFKEIRPQVRALLGMAMLAAFIVVDQMVGDFGITLLQMFLILFAARDISFRRICKVIVWTALVLWLCVVMSDLFGFYHIVHEVSGNGSRVREYLNFNYMTFGAIYFNNIVFCGLYAYTDPDRRGRGGRMGYRSEVGWGPIILLSLSVLWIYAMTDTALSFVTAALYIGLYVLVFKFRVPFFNNTLFNRILSVVLFPLLAAFTIWLASSFVPKDPFYEAINDFSHDRINMAWEGIQTYGIHLFGTDLHENTDRLKGDYFYVDSGYMKILLQDGVLILLLVILFYCILFYAAVVEHDKLLCIWVVCTAIYSVFNNMLINPVMNGSFLSFWYAISLLRWHRQKKRGGVGQRKEAISVEQ